MQDSDRYCAAALLGLLIDHRGDRTTGGVLNLAQRHLVEIDDEGALPVVVRKASEPALAGDRL